jgi:hypothetical protein
MPLSCPLVGSAWHQVTAYTLLLGVWFLKHTSVAGVDEGLHLVLIKTLKHATPDAYHQDQPGPLLQNLPWLARIDCN